MKYILFFLIILLSSFCQAGLDEVLLHSEDNKCTIRYLTTSPVKGQHIKVNKECSDGWVQGYASVEISTPRHQMEEILIYNNIHLCIQF